MANSVIIDIVLDDGSVKQVFGRIQKEAGDTGKKAGRGMSVPMVSAFKAIGAAAAVAGAAITAAFVSGSRAAMVQEDAVLSLNQSLANAGRFSEGASKRFQEFASEIQRTTRFGDEDVLGLAALANNFAKSEDQAKALTKAALDLSVATGRDARSSIEMLGRTLTGEAGRINQMVPAVAGLSKEALQAGAAIDMVAQRFAGRAESQANNFRGRLTQMTNAFGDLREEIGFFVTQSPVMVELLVVIREAFEAAGEALGGMREGGDMLGDLIIRTVQLGQVLNEYLGKPIVIVGNLARSVISSMILGVQTLVMAIFNSVNWLVQKLPSIGGALDGFKKMMDAAAHSTFDTFADQLDATRENWSNTFDTEMVGSLDTFLVNLEDRLRNAKSLNQDFVNNPFGDGMSPEDAGAKVAEPILSIGDAFVQMSQGASDALIELRNTGQQVFRELGKAAVMGIGQGVGNAFAAMGQALVEGENALDAFLKSFLQTIGQQAVQLGTSFILQGIAHSLNPVTPGMGAGLIKAGAALALFGGALGAVSGPSPGTAGGDPMRVRDVGDSGAPGEDPIDISDSIQERRADTAIAVNIQGDVYDSDETGMRIVDVINQAFDKQGVTIKRGAIA
jgi:hypothetical protein